MLGSPSKNLQNQVTSHCLVTSWSLDPWTCQRKPNRNWSSPNHPFSGASSCDFCFTSIPNFRCFCFVSKLVSGVIFQHEKKKPGKNPDLWSSRKIRTKFLKALVVSCSDIKTLVESQPEFLLSGKFPWCFTAFFFKERQISKRAEAEGETFLRE